MNPVFKFDSSDPEFNTIYAYELNQYLTHGVDWSAKPFDGASIEDMQQFGGDSFGAGWLAYRSQAAQLLKNALPWLHLYVHQAKTGYDINKVNQEIKNITEFLEVNQTNPWKTPYGCPKPEVLNEELEKAGITQRVHICPFCSHKHFGTVARGNIICNNCKNIFPVLGRDWQAEALKKRQFPAGGIMGEMRKQAGREIMADIENKTLEILHGFKKTYEYVPEGLWHEFNRTNQQLAELWANGQTSTQEYKDLQKQANELADCMNKVKKEAIEKEAGDKLGHMVAQAMQVTDSFVKAAKALQVFNREAKEADAIRQKIAPIEDKTKRPAGDPKKPITDENGFLFIAGNGDILWALHDGAKYCFCNWEAGAWIGWKVEESAVIEAGHTQLPIFLDHFIRSIMPTKHPNKPR